MVSVDISLTPSLPGVSLPLSLTLFPRCLTTVRQDFICLQLAPPRPPGTDLKVGTESRRHEEVFTGRWCHELRVIHTN